MDSRIVELAKWGCNIYDALERFLNEEEFYLECIYEISRDQNFERLTNALEIQDTDEAFDSAHTLKGVLGNLGLTPMYNKASEIVEPLRGGNFAGLQEKNNELLEMREHLVGILNN